MKEPTEHELIIRDVCEQYPEARRTGFMASIEAIMKEKFPGRVIPDAYLIDPDNMVVVVYEVEVTNPCSRHKLALYEEIGWWLDDSYWTLVLHQIDRYGGSKSTQPQTEELLKLARLRERERAAGIEPPLMSPEETYIAAQFREILQRSKALATVSDPFAA